MQFNIYRYFILCAAVIAHLGMKAQTSEVVVDDIRYVLDDATRTASIVGVTHSFLEHYNLKSEVNGYLVRKIKKSSFSGCKSITSVAVPHTVREIGQNAFSDLPKLTTVTLPSDLEVLEEAAFAGCSALTSVTIPKSVRRIGKWAFLRNTSLSSLVIEEGVDTIGEAAFQDCSLLPSVLIPGSVKNIESWAFRGCQELAALTISEGVVSIGDFAFAECTKIDKVSIPESVTTLGRYAFYGCSALSTIVLPNKLERIERSTFEICTSLSSITIPESVKYIGDNAFSSCTSLLSVEIPFGVEEIGQFPFIDADLTHIYVHRKYSTLGIDGRKTTVYSPVGYPDLYDYYKSIIGRNRSKYFVPMRVGEEGYSTFYSSEPIILPEGVVGCVVEGLNENGQLLLKEAYYPGSVVAGGEALLLKGTLPYTRVHTEEGVSANPLNGNWLRGSDTETLFAGTEGECYYKLSHDAAAGRMPGFYRCAENAAPFVTEAHKAYLAVPAPYASTAVEGYLLDDAVVTGLATPAPVNAAENVYAVDGRVINRNGAKLPAGLYIINGKKTFLR